MFLNVFFFKYIIFWEKKKLFWKREMAERLYCGNKTPVPEGYAGYDTRLNCLRRGVGVGLYRRGQIPPQANKKPPTFFQRVPLLIWILLLCLVVTTIVLLILYLIK
jgi:hypothetical protein